MAIDFSEPLVSMMSRLARSMRMREICLAMPSGEYRLKRRSRLLRLIPVANATSFTDKGWWLFSAINRKAFDISGSSAAKESVDCRGTSFLGFTNSEIAGG